ncbi:MAG: hypothetical protein SVK54_07330 [candidate division WOR-3 bacterium]|nr:hypothetical protein [candidate division WOR-3 bacterium]
MKLMFSALFLIIAITAAGEETYCPFGLVNDSFPGECVRYIDEDSDSICDYSQIDENTPDNEFNGQSDSIDDKYQLKIMLPIWFALFILTVPGKRNKLVKYRHVNQFWNWVLLASFIITAGTSVLLLGAEYSVIDLWAKESLYMHNLFGTVFILSSFSHIYLKWNYYLNCIKRKKCEK